MKTSPGPVTPSSPSLANIARTHEEVFKYLSTCKLHTATGPDGVSSQMLRGTAEAITPAITAILNHSLREMKVPEDGKTSNVTPIPKDGDPSSPSIYRV